MARGSTSGEGDERPRQAWQCTCAGVVCAIARYSIPHHHQAPAATALMLATLPIMFDSERSCLADNASPRAAPSHIAVPAEGVKTIAQGIGLACTSMCVIGRADESPRETRQAQPRTGKLCSHFITPDPGSWDNENGRGSCSSRMPGRCRVCARPAVGAVVPCGQPGVKIHPRIPSQRPLRHFPP